MQLLNLPATRGFSVNIDIKPNDKFNSLWSECYISCDEKKLYLGEDLLFKISNAFIVALLRSKEEFEAYCKNSHESVIGVFTFGGTWNYVEANYGNNDINFLWRTKNKTLLGETQLLHNEARKWLEALRNIRPK